MHAKSDQILGALDIQLAHGGCFLCAHGFNTAIQVFCDFIYGLPLSKAAQHFKLARGKGCQPLLYGAAFFGLAFFSESRRVVFDP